MDKKFKIYPALGIARLGNGKATKDDAVFSPEVPWANLFETDLNYLNARGEIRKQAQRFYVYQCDDFGKPESKLDLSEYSVVWTAEVANKKPFWYDFNNCLDLSVQTDNQNLSPTFFEQQIAPGIDASYRNPNVLNQSKRQEKGVNYRRELVNSPGPVSVSSDPEEQKKTIDGSFPFAGNLGKSRSKVAEALNQKVQSVPLGTLEYDNGSLIFYGADGHSASLNPSDLNTDFADNSNWYDDICDGRITAKLTHLSTGHVILIEDAKDAAWIATAPPDYAPQIQPISTMYDLVNGTTNDSYSPDFSLVFPLFYRLYRMQWVNMGDFLAPSFRETIDQLTLAGLFKYLYTNDGSLEAHEVRDQIFSLFRDPQYNSNNEPIIPSKEDTDLPNLTSGVEGLKLPFYPGDGVNYPGSPAQWFAIPPILYAELQSWKDGNFPTLAGDFPDMDSLGLFYQGQFAAAAEDSTKAPMLMTRAVLETLYGGGFHPGVELTWPFRHREFYKTRDLRYPTVTDEAGIYGIREIRLKTSTMSEQADIFYNDFGFQINAQDITDSMKDGNDKDWLWKNTPGDLTKWMGIPWQSDAGSCQAVFTGSQYPVPAWWAANLPVDVLTEESLAKLQDASILGETKKYIYGSRLPWLQTADTGFVGYHADGGYMNGLIAMVYQWKNVGMVTGRNSGTVVEGIPETVYVSFDSKNKRDRPYIYLGEAIASQKAPPSPPSIFYTNELQTIWIPKDKEIWLSSSPDGKGLFSVDDEVCISVNGTELYLLDFSNRCSGQVQSLLPVDLTSEFQQYVNTYVTLNITYRDLCGGFISATNFFLVFK